METMTMAIEVDGAREDRHTPHGTARVARSIRQTALSAIVAIGAAFGSAAHAGGLEQLRAFIADVRAAKSDFTQTVTDANGKRVQDSSGTFAFARPGKFRWTYAKPYEQVIVGDGQKVWIHDPELQQVTVRKLGDALGSSPAALLAGSNELDRAYRFTALPAKDGLEWVEAVPTDPDSTFEKMRLGFRGGSPDTMQLFDRLGQTTSMRFVKLQRNPKLDANLFRFTPPPGADVVGDK
jgi:outer membrane lipoprotein carrier protein